MGVLEQIGLLIGNEDDFKRSITQKLKADARFLEKSFWHEGKQVTLLNFLIKMHSQENNDLRRLISWLIQQGARTECDQSIHLACEKNNNDLLQLLIGATQGKSSSSSSSKASIDDSERVIEVLQPVEPEQVDLNSRDEKGCTLLYRTINNQDINQLKDLLTLNLNIHQASKDMQPLHQAIRLDFAEGVNVLLEAGAQIDNPFGKKKETPLLLAASEGKIQALEVLLAHINDNKALLEAQNNDNNTAMILLCARLREKKEPQNAIKGIAMLICHGAEVPAWEQWRHLLRDNREALLNAVEEYAPKAPANGAKFLRAAHSRDNHLHEIIYAGNTWAKSFRHMFGRPDDIAFRLERIIPAPSSLIIEDDSGSSSEDASFVENEKRFADFVKRYDESIKGRTFFNPWSEMRWKITLGEVTNIKQIEEYCGDPAHKNTRSAQILREMGESAGTELHARVE